MNQSSARLPENHLVALVVVHQGVHGGAFLSVNFLC
jgi:hypothetical protein